MNEGLPDATPLLGTVEANFDALPIKMREAKRWLLFKYGTPAKEGAKPPKRPYYVDGQPRSGHLDSPEDIARMGTFEEAIAALSTGRYAGFGFAMGPDGTGNCWQGVDFDHLSKHPDNKILTEEFPGYVEVSPSGDGVHAIGYGREFGTLSPNETDIEAYAKKRYLTVTGKSITISMDVPCLAEFVEKKLKPKHSSKSDAPTPALSEAGSVQVNPKILRDLQSAMEYLNSDDRGVWIDTGMALKELGNPGRALFLDWSSQSPKFDPADAAKTWDSFNPTERHYQSVFYDAIRAGWSNGGKDYAAAKELVDPARFKRKTLQEFVSREPTVWRMKGLLPHDGVAMVFGASGSGKSFLCLDIAMSIALGKPWRDKKTVQGYVTYVCAEGANDFTNRCKAYSTEYGVSPEWFSVIDAAPNLTLDADVKALILELSNEPVDVIFCDTLACMSAGADENSAKDMGIVLQNCKRISRECEALVILVHHSGKDTTKGARGSSSIQAAMDTVIEVSRKIDGRDATVKKQKGGEDGEKFDFRLMPVVLGEDEDGDLITSCIVKHEVSVPEIGASTGVLEANGKYQTAIFDVLVNGGLDEKELLRDSVERIPALLSAGRDTRRQQVKDALNKLLGRGLVIETAGRFSLAGA